MRKGRFYMQAQYRDGRPPEEIRVTRREDGKVDVVSKSKGKIRYKDYDTFLSWWEEMPQLYA